MSGWDGWVGKREHLDEEIPAHREKESPSARHARTRVCVEGPVSKAAARMFQVSGRAGLRTWETGSCKITDATPFGFTQGPVSR